MASAFVVLTGAQSNGCDPGEDPGIVCQVPVEPECPDGTLEPGGVDDNGCPLPSLCIPPVEDPCLAAGGTLTTTCALDDACPERDCGCQDYCDCGPYAYFDGLACVPWAPPDPVELCELTGGTPYEWCDDGCWADEGGEDGCLADAPACWTDCDCGYDAYFDPYLGCVQIDPGYLCEVTGGHLDCDGTCECPYGMIYDVWSGCIADPVMLCEGTGGFLELYCEAALDDGQQGEEYCWEQCNCGEGYVFDWTYGCYPGTQLLCEWSGGTFGEVCSDDWGEHMCWEDCTCPEGTYFDYYSGCVIDYMTACENAGGEWTVTCDEQWGSCWEDCVCPEGTWFDWVSSCVGVEDCINGVDDDGNGAIDCEDWACYGAEGCPIVY